MSLFNQLTKATYNGVEFLVDSSDMNYGRKTQTFEYPNKKYRYVEDLGENLRTFNLNAIITGDNDYLIRREALILALQKKGIGILTHPFYGMVFVVVKNYTVTEDLTNLGECVFKITFEETRQNIYPISGEESIATIEEIVNEIAPYLESFFITKFSVSFQHNTIDAASKCDKLNNTLQPKVPVSTEYDVLNDFHAKSTAFGINKYSLIKDNPRFSTAIYDLLASYNDLGKTDSDSYLLNSAAYYFGIDDIPIKETTAQRIQRSYNRKVINNFVNTNLLMNLYQNALQINYLDDQQIAIKEIDLEEKYQYLISNNILDTDILQLLEKLRNSVKKFYNKLKVNISKVITVDVPKTPLTVLLYRYYAGFDNENEIISLNDLNNVTKISGKIKILSEAAQ